MTIILNTIYTIYTKIDFCVQTPPILEIIARGVSEPIPDSYIPSIGINTTKDFSDNIHHPYTPHTLSIACLEHIPLNTISYTSFQKTRYLEILN